MENKADDEVVERWRGQRKEIDGRERDGQEEEGEGGGGKRRRVVGSSNGSGAGGGKRKLLTAAAEREGEGRGRGVETDTAGDDNGGDDGFEWVMGVPHLRRGRGTCRRSVRPSLP